MSDIAVIDIEGDTTFHYAASLGHLRIVNYYLEETNIDPAVKGLDGSTAIHLAAIFGHLTVVQAISKYLTNINPGNNKKESPLHLASRNGHSFIVEYIVDRLEDSRTKDYQNETSDEMNQNIDINPGDINGVTPLHISAKEGHLPIVQYFVGRLEDINPQDKDLTTPLHLASQNGHLDIVKILTKHMTNISPMTTKKVAPIHLAAWVGHLHIVEYLAERLEDFNPASGDFWNYWTPLHMASRNGHLSIVKYLSGKVIDPTIQDKNGKTPFDLAFENDHLDVSTFLEQFDSK